MTQESFPLCITLPLILIITAMNIEQRTKDFISHSFILNILLTAQPPREFSINGNLVRYLRQVWLL